MLYVLFLCQICVCEFGPGLKFDMLFALSGCATEALIFLLTLLITFPNSLDPDQAPQDVGPDLDPNSFNTLMVYSRKNFLQN